MNPVRHRLFLLAAAVSVSCGSMWAQGWQSARMHDGRIRVAYRITEQYNAAPLIEDTATTVAALTMDACIAVLEDVEHHRDFTGDELSKTVQTVSDSERVVYYYTDNPWPIANSDCVGVITRHHTGNTVVFEFVGAQSPHASSSTDRMTARTTRYSFTDQHDGTVRITVTGRSTPPVWVPMWLIRAAFPAAPATGLLRLVKAISAHSSRPYSATANMASTHSH